MKPDRLQADGALIGAHALDHAGSKGHRLAYSVEVHAEQRYVWQAHPLSQQRSPELDRATHPPAATAGF